MAISRIYQKQEAFCAAKTNFAPDVSVLYKTSHAILVQLIHVIIPLIRLFSSAHAATSSCICR
ncbi:hypothetical protein SPHINGO8BC_60516 [Sphingobacterium multivorum]|uniref:Uncharacterized protein n=1 Tax=Sphingobacterium multivorum TaxID=28454 RepID=A0A654DJH0_SPHMU|nr:hypothetical protein SPHINGO8BC_60516 [Sphingobacterium multivorum]